MARSNGVDFFFVTILLASLSQSCMAVAPAPAPARGPAPSPISPASKVKLDCGCTEDYDPVCAPDGQTYGNPCVADCAQQAIVFKGVCPECTLNTVYGCPCPTFAPVCHLGITSNCIADFNTCGPNDAGCTFTPGVCPYNFVSTTIPGAPLSSAPPGGVAAAAANTVLPTGSLPKYNYADALHKSILFYDIQRSGNRTVQKFAWLGDSCFNCKGPNGEDLSGGFLEAGGSYLKIGTQSAFSVTMMAWSLIAFEGGFTKMNEAANILEHIKWGADFVMKSLVGPETFVGLLGYPNEDFDFYGPHEEYEQHVPGGDGKMGSARSTVLITPENPAVEFLYEAAATLAASAITLKSSDPGYAAKLLETARTLYALGNKYPFSSPKTSYIGMTFASSGFLDEKAWVEIWLYLATGEANFLTTAIATYASIPPTYSNLVLTLNEKWPALHILLYQITHEETYATAAKTVFDQWLGGTVKHTPLGLAYAYKWGGVRDAVGISFMAYAHSTNLIANNADPDYAARIFNYATYQLNYILGDGGRSLVIGFGPVYPQFVWHKLSYNSYIDWPTRGNRSQWMGLDNGPWSVSRAGQGDGKPIYIQYAKLDFEASLTPQRFIAYGALYANPLFDDSIITSRKDYTLAEPTTEGQGYLLGSLAALSDFFSAHLTPGTDCGLDMGWTHPNATIRANSVTNLGGACGKA